MNPDPSALSKLIKQAKAGRFGDNFVSIGEAADKELDAMVAERVKLFEVIERNSVGNLRALYGEKVQVRKSEINSQPEKVPPTG